jgi:glutamate-ammonia-ligase adenylyltransferase
MKNPVWATAIRQAADPHRARGRYDLLAAAGAAPQLERATPEQARILCALFSGSEHLSAWLTAHPELLAAIDPDALGHPRRAQGLSREVNAWLEPALSRADFEGALAQLRLFKQREMLRIAARDLARLGGLLEIIQELSDVADVCLETVWRICDRQLRGRFGQPFHQDAAGRWQPTRFAVLGMGKLGGRELNYSSDVDVLFVYDDEGQAFRNPPGRGRAAAGGLPNHQFFRRLAEAFVAEVGRMTGDGMLYRIDLRLRPEGDAGPLARSLPSYEIYYAQSGQTWERMMLLKARHVAGGAALSAEFLESVQSFRYPRSIGEGVMREVAAMKDRIENEVVKAGELDRNVKLGRGGIREIEFVAQTLQLIHGGRLPFLQGAQTLVALGKLAQYELLPSGDARQLAAAYEFLRDVEHRLQMDDNLQTHTIPVNPAALDRLAALMGLRSAADFEAARAAHSRHVRAIYHRLLRSEAPGPAPELPRTFEGNETEWKTALAKHSFKQPDQALRMLREFVLGPGYVHVSNRTSELALNLVAHLFRLCPVQDSPPPAPNVTVVSDPDRVLTRLDGFIAAYGTRAMLFELWTGHPPLFDLLVLLFDRSEFLAERAIRSPELVDELVLSDRLRRSKSAAKTLSDLRHGSGDADQRLWLRRYHQAELMRIGLRDILGLADAEQAMTELSALADACLQYALETALRKHGIKGAPVAIIGLGKLGGAEINYGSDLDILFVTDAPEARLPGLQRIAVEVTDLLATPTELGAAFHTDARLRPDGEKGLLVNTFAAYEEYYRHRARLWEIQTITRTRPVAGNMGIGARFQRLAAVLTDFRPENVAAGFRSRDDADAPPVPRKTRGPAGSRAATASSSLAAYERGWRGEIRRMRDRIEKERTPPGKDALAIKTGCGGLMDAEFIAQVLCLANGWHEANTLAALERARAAGALAGREAGKLLESYRQLRRVEGILRRWSFEGEILLPDEPEAFQRVAVRCGFDSAVKFRTAMAGWRRHVRAAYNKAV